MTVKNDLRDRIDSYVRHYQSLLRDIGDVLDDHEFEHRKGTTTWYAVDFSEVRSFVRPEESHEVSPDSWGSDPLKQFSVLSQFFGKQNIILLEPYAFELQDFYYHETRRAMEKNIDAFLDAVEDMQRIRRHKMTRKLHGLASEAEKRSLNDSEVREAIAFFTANAPVLVAIARGANLDSIARLRLLMASGRFVDLKTVAPRADGFQEAEAARIYERLKVLRLQRGEQFYRDDATKKDARAIELLRAANESLLPHRRILLVSRSSSMSRAVEQERETNAAWSRIPRFVRHPRVFSAAYRPPEGAAAGESLTALRFRKQLIELFIETAGTIAPLSDEKYAELESLAQQIQETQKDFSEGESLANALAGGESPEGGGEMEKVARELLSYLRGRLFESARGHIRTILDEATRTLTVLGGKMEILESTFGSILYPIGLGNADLAAHVQRCADEWTITVREASSLFEKAATRGISNDDFLFMMGISLGAISRWKVAERSVRQAIAMAKEARKPLAEARFFHALCLRKMKKKREEEVRRLREAVDEIDAAAQERGGVDARLLNEKGVLQSMLLSLGESTGGDTPEVLFHQALALPHSKKLEVQLRNNLAYLAINIPPLDRDKASGYLDELEKVLVEGYERTHWPSFVFDTLTYGRYVIHRDTATLAELNQRADELKPLLERGDLTTDERSEIRRHLGEIQKTIAERGTTAA